MLGNMKFVGNLLCSKILSSKIIFECVEQLMGAETRSDETVETLAAFLNTIGPMFDTENYSRYQQLNDVFSRVMKLTEVKRQAIREEQGFSSQGYSAPAREKPAPRGDDEWATVGGSRGGGGGFGKKLTS